MTNKNANSPTDVVLEYIEEGVKNKKFKPGDRLPSERKLAELLNVGRPHVRQAFQKLETYGIVQTFPQSGTVISQFSKEQIDNLVHDALQEEKYDFFSLVYVRVVLEIEACKLAAQYRTDEDIDKSEKSLAELEKTNNPDERVKKDFAFHHTIYSASHNPVIVSLLEIITPDIMRYYHKYRFCTVPERIVSSEHREYIQNMKGKNVANMKKLVMRHLKNQIETAEALSGREMSQFKD